MVTNAVYCMEAISGSSVERVIRDSGAAGGGKNNFFFRHSIPYRRVDRCGLFPVDQIDVPRLNTSFWSETRAW
jgi:hypothetical protein